MNTLPAPDVCNVCGNTELKRIVCSAVYRKGSHDVTVMHAN